jgi:Zn-dependent protease with chaperone function
MAADEEAGAVSGARTGSAVGGGPPAAPLRTQPLWIRVDQNRVKLAFFVVLFVTGSALLLTMAMVGVPGLLFGIPYTVDMTAEAPWYWSTFRTVLLGTFVALLAVGSLASAVQLANAEDWVRNRFTGTKAQRGAYPALESVVADMALAAGLGAPPDLVVLDSPAINAYALGTARQRAVIGVTRGFLETVPSAEQRAVVAALVARIVSGDILFATALAALMGPLKAVRGSGKAIAAGGAGCAESGCADGCSSVPDLSEGCGCLFDDTDSPGSCLGVIGVGLFIVVVAIITYAAVVSAAWIVTVWGRALHRTAYEKADAEGMLLLKDPEAMLAALTRANGADTTISGGDPSYDGIFFTQTSGTPAIERVERRRLRRLAEVLGVDGIAVMAEDGRRSAR